MKVNLQRKLEAVAREMEKKPGECNILKVKGENVFQEVMINGVKYC